MLISLIEYAKIHGKSRKSAEAMAGRGGFKTAQKIGRNWVIDDKEEWPDRRVKSGNYKKWRHKK